MLAVHEHECILEATKITTKNDKFIFSRISQTNAAQNIGKKKKQRHK